MEVRRPDYSTLIHLRLLIGGALLTTFPEALVGRAWFVRRHLGNPLLLLGVASSWELVDTLLEVAQHHSANFLLGSRCRREGRGPLSLGMLPF